MIAICCDHAGYRLKLAIMRHLESRGLEYFDFGSHSDESVDYPEYAARAARSVSSGESCRAIAICGVGIGMSIVANKFAGVRAAHCTDTFSAVMSRRHNDLNVLTLGARAIGEGAALMIVDAWLDTPFDGGRHLSRVEQITALEKTPV